VKYASVQPENGEQAIPAMSLTTRIFREFHVAQTSQVMDLPIGVLLRNQTTNRDSRKLKLSAF